MSVKRVLIRNGPAGPLVPLATFRLSGDRLSAQWHNKPYQKEMEELGQRAMVDGRLRTLRPSDGALFFRQLESMYAHSTLVVVETVEG
jgi:hypothetical protein